MTRTMPPVEVAIERFGGVRALARAIGRDHSSISRWRKRRAIPTNMQARVMWAAAEGRIRLTAKEMIYGATR